MMAVRRSNASKQFIYLFKFIVEIPEFMLAVCGHVSVAVGNFVDMFYNCDFTASMSNAEEIILRLGFFM